MPTLNNVLYGLLNTHTGEAQTFSKVTTWIDGSAMDDSKCDGTIFRKKDAEYFKLNYTGPVNIKWFGAKGDGVADDTPAFQRFIDAFIGVGETALLEHGTFLVKDLIIPTGYRFMSNQKPASNSHAFVNATIKPAPGAEYIFILPATTRYACLENLNIDGDYHNHPGLLAAISFTGAYSKLLGNNINGCAQACVIMPEATTCTIKDNFMGGWFGPAPVFTGPNDFRGTLQIEICGDSYIVDNEFSASIPYFISYPDPSDVLRDKTNGRICAMAVRTYFGNSVCTGNIFENGDRGVVLAGCVYSYFGGNRYELSGMGNLYIRGAMYNTTFVSERFSDGSLAGDGVYDDIELATGAVGNVSFISPTFLILSNSAIPPSSFKVRYNLTNYASLEIAWVEPVYSSAYVAEGYINTTLPAFPVREVIGQYHPQDPVYKSSLTIGRRLPNDSIDVGTTGYVKIDTGTTEASQNRTGIVGWYKANDLRVSAIGFDNADNVMSFALTNPGVYSFSNGGLFAAKDGGTYLNLQSNDGLGACAINFYSDPSQDHIGLISLNAETGQFNIVSSGQMLFQSPGFTYIGGNITVAKAGGVSLDLLCSDSTGTSMFRISSDPLATHEFRISMNNATGVTRLSSSDDIIIGGTGSGNMRFQQNGLTFIPQTPSTGDIADVHLLGRDSTTGEQVIIDHGEFIQAQTAVAQSLGYYINSPSKIEYLTDTTGTALGAMEVYRTIENSDTKAPQGIRSVFRAYANEAGHEDKEFISIYGGIHITAANTQPLTNASEGIIGIASTASNFGSGDISWMSTFSALGGYSATATATIDKYAFYKISSFSTDSNPNLLLVNNMAGVAMPLLNRGVNNIHLLTGVGDLDSSIPGYINLGTAVWPTGNWNIYDNTGYNNYLGTGNLLLNSTTDDTSGSKLQVNGTITTTGIIGGTDITDNLTFLNYNASTTGMVLSQYGLTIGGGATSNNTLLKTTRTFSNITSNVCGVRAEPSAFVSTAPTTNGIIGGLFVPAITAANTQDWTTSVSMQGISVAPTINPGAVGTINQIMCGTFALNLKSAGATVTNAVGIRVYTEPATISTIINRTFVHIGDITPVLGNWCIYVEHSDHNYLGSGATLINTTVDDGSSKLQIAGKATITNTAAEQLRLAYNGTNYATITVGSTGITTFNTEGTSAQFAFSDRINAGGGIQTGSVGVNANLNITTGSDAVATTDPKYLFGTGSTNYRVGLAGVNSTSMTSASNYANLLVGAAPITTYTSGSHDLVTNVAIVAPVIASGGATVTNTASLYVHAAPSGGTTNYALLIASGDTRLQNLYAQAPAYSTGGYANLVRNTTTGRYETANATVMSVATATDANYVIPDGIVVAVLPVITASRTVTLPTLQTGQLLTIHNRNSAGFSWSFTNGNVKDAAGVAITNLTNQTAYQFYYDGTDLYKIN